jgi:hypothetical protein
VSVTKGCIEDGKECLPSQLCAAADAPKVAENVPDLIEWDIDRLRVSEIGYIV